MRGLRGGNLSGQMSGLLMLSSDWIEAIICWLKCGGIPSCFKYRVESRKGHRVEVKFCKKLRYVYPVRCL